MSSHQNVRDRILARLHASGAELTTVPEAPLPPELSLDREAKIELLAAMMTAMRTDVNIVDTHNWSDRLKELDREKGWKRLLYVQE